MSRWARRVMTALFARFPSLTERWLERHPMDVTEDVPWTPFEKPLASARIGLVTTGGVHLDSQTAFDMSDSDGDASWRVLPADTPPGRLRITHDYYETGSARRDVNVVYPAGRLHELVSAGRIGGVVDEHAGIMGHVDGKLLPVLASETAPSIARHFAAQLADAVLLVPS